MYGKELEEITLEEKNKYIEWQIDKINNAMYSPNYLCIDFAKWLELNEKIIHTNFGFNLTLFPELLRIMRKTIKKEGGLMTIDYNTCTLTSSPIAFGAFEKINDLRIKILEIVRTKINK